MVKEKIVILGHTGFVGRHLYNKLRNKSMFEVYGFSSKEVDLLNLGACQKLADICDGKTTVIMVAAITRSRGDDLSALNNNVKMILNLANFLSRRKIKHLIYTSSIAVYGNKSKTSITETSPINPDSFYSSAKACGELILKRICEKSGIALTTLRMGKIYGKGDTTSPISIFSQNIVSGKPIEIFGDGSHQLYCVHKNDLFSVVKRVVLEEIKGDYNVTPSNGIAMLELTELLFKLSGKTVEVKFKKAISSPILLTFNISKIRSAFGEFPFINLDEGLKDYFTIIP